MSENISNNIFEWLSQSPDINPIENVFAWLKQHVAKHHPKTLDALETCIVESWNSLTPEFLKPYWKSMKRRCQLVIDSDGNKINY